MEHTKLFIPGPTEVRKEILEAQAQPMIGHRSQAGAELLANIQEKLRIVFSTDHRVLITASSGTGLQEAAIRNCTDKCVLNCVNGAFGHRWRKVSESNAKVNEVLEVDWGKPILPEQVVQRLEGGGFDAVTIVHNETSTGVTSPIREIARAVRGLPGGDDILILVDSVSGLAGIPVEVDEWDLDVVLTSSQKALALPPGLALCSVSDRAMEKARTVADRGYYFDFLELERSLSRNQTPNTPPISLLFALDMQLDHILTEGMEARVNRHLAMRDMVLSWADKSGFGRFADKGFESPTVSCLRARGSMKPSDLVSHARSHQMAISNGYGPLSGITFRIAHMGDMTIDDVGGLLEVLDRFPGV